MILLCLMLLVIFSNVMTAIKMRDYRLRLEDANKHIEESRPKIEDDEDVLSYLEAAAVVTPFAKRLLKAGQDMKALPAHEQPQATPVQIITTPPWTHDPNIRVPCEEQWRLFLEDMNREEDDNDRLRVLRHWTLERQNHFSLIEVGYILNLFEYAEDRQEVREIFALQKKRDATKEKVRANPKKAGTDHTGPR